MISKCYLNFYFVAFILNILAALDKPTAGEVLLNGKNLVSLKEKEISAFRREHLGFVFQDFNLLDNFSLKDNIFLPLVLSGVDYREMEKRLAPIASLLGIDVFQCLYLIAAKSGGIYFFEVTYF